ncbi:MAG TPA: hypothetical protein VHF26_09155 [Trebonia sp.]|nr:hypothetical protein [Trebonia sp.]
MPEKAVISHRGEKYEIGRGKRFYGIWVVGAPYDAPVDRWPENPDGWRQAWGRFASMEVPGTITAVPSGRRNLRLGIGRRRAGQPDSAPESGAAESGAAEGGAAEGSAPAGGAGPGTAGLIDKTGLMEKAGASARPGRGTALLAGEGLLVLGVVLGLVGLFPAYQGRQSLLSQWDQVIPHLCYVIGWALTAAMIALSVARQSSTAQQHGGARRGALFGLGLSAVTFGLFLADLGQATSGGAAVGLGLVLSLLGWLACTAGSALALGTAGQEGAGAAGNGPAGQRTSAYGTPAYGMPAYGTPAYGTPAYGMPAYGTPGYGTGRPAFGRPARPGRGHAGPLALLVLAAIGTAAAFAPAWDRFVLTSSVQGTSQTVTAGNAFDGPGLAIAGNVAVMVAVVAVAALAALWRPPRQGGLLLAGAILPLVTQAISAIIQAGQPASPATFGISDAQASAVGLTITSGLTGIFWVYFVFVISLLVSCAWLFTEPGHPAMPGFPGSPWLAPGGEPATRDAAGAPVSEDTHSGGTEAPHTDDGGTDDTGADHTGADHTGSDHTGTEKADRGTGIDGGGQSAYA